MQTTRGGTIRPLEQRLVEVRQAGKAGVSGDCFAMLAGLSETAHLVQMFDSAVIRAHVSAAGAKPSRRCFASSARQWGGKRVRSSGDHGAVPVIPHRSNRKAIPVRFARAPYRRRARIEQMIGKLKRAKRIALRYKKTARNFRSIVTLAATCILIKSVHKAQSVSNGLIRPPNSPCLAPSMPHPAFGVQGRHEAGSR